MARKKGKKKKDVKKMDIKKELKKKKSKKKEEKKKKLKKKTVKKGAGKKDKTLKAKVVKVDKPKEQATRYTDHSSNYNVRNAVQKLRSLTSPEQVQIFTKGEERVTLTRAIPAVMKRFG